MTRIERILGHISKKMNSVENQSTSTATADVRALVIHSVWKNFFFLVFILMKNNSYIQTESANGSNGKYGW